MVADQPPALAGTGAESGVLGLLIAGLLAVITSAAIGLARLVRATPKGRRSYGRDRINAGLDGEGA